MILKNSRLGDVCKIQSGNSIAPKEKDDLYRNVNEGLPYVATKDIGLDGSINFENGVRIPSKFDKKFRLSEKNSVLVCAEGGSAGKKIAYSNKDCYFVNKLFSIKPKIQIDAKFIYYYTLSNIFQNQFKESLHGLIGGVSLSKIKNFKITYPSLLEQQHIVAKLDAAFIEIDKNIDIKKNSYDEFNSLKLSILKKMFDGPKIQLGNLYEITSSKRVFKSEWKEKGVPFYRAREIVKLANNKPFKNPIYISEDMYNLYSKKYTVPKEGDILITGVGTLGITYLVKKNDKFYFKDGNIIWLKKKDTNINSNYIESVFKSPFVRAQITNSIGATVGTLTIQKAKELSIPYPPLEIQNKIMNKINNFFIYLYDYEKNLQKNINNYVILKNSLIKNYLESKSG